MPFQILSLSGGGFLGLYTITVLSELERGLGRPLASCFDLLAGTSVGGIIVLGLGLGKSAEEIKDAFEENGAQIFSNRPAPTSWLGQTLDSCRALLSPKYDGTALRHTIERVVGRESRLGDLARPVVVPAVNLTKGRPQVFKTDHHPNFRLDHRRRVVDVALATTAAPTYFPLAEIDDELYADGGLFANSPDLIALHEAEHFFGASTDNIRMLSVGTTTTQFSLSHTTGQRLGLVGWRRRLAPTILSSQQLDISYIAQHKLRDRYLRIDEVQSKEQERDLGLDVATTDAIKTIRGLAAGSVQSAINRDVLTQILRHQAPNPTFYHRKV